MNYNRVLKRSDYAEFGGLTNRKQWEVAMALRALRDNGATGPESVILGAGAGREGTIFELANEDDCRQVVPTDIYNSPGSWDGWHSSEFLTNPKRFSPVWSDADRIKPKHADMRELPFEDNTFDGVFSSGSIEHVGVNDAPNYEGVARSAQEIARVTKPGGIISISTEWRLHGSGWGWSNCMLFHEGNVNATLLDHFSGCEPIDEPDYSFDGEFSDAIVLADLVSGRDRIENHPIEYVLREHQFIYTSVHFALRKL